MKQTLVTGLLAVSLALANALAFAAGQYGPGVSDTEIKIGNTMPYSGPAPAPTITPRSNRCSCKNSTVPPGRCFGDVMTGSGS